MRWNWAMIWIPFVVFGSGCTRADRSPPQQEAQPSTKPNREQPYAQEQEYARKQETAYDKAATKDQSSQGDLYEELRAQENIVPGTALIRAKIPEPTAEELADPRMKHLNEATKRTVVIFRKLQQQVPELTSGNHDGPVPVANEAKMFKALDKKTKKNKKNKRKRRKKRRRVKRGIK